MKVAVTGITSGVGRRFAEMAVAQEHEVRGLVRDEGRADAQALRDLGVHLTGGDLMKRDALDTLCEGVDAVVHMAAHVGDWGPEEQFVRVNVQGTIEVLEAAARADVGRFVQLSTVAVYGRPERGRIDERWPTRKSGAPYDDTKLEAERQAFARGRELGIEVAAVRPPLIYGPYDRNFIPRALRLFELGPFPLIDGGRGLMNVVSADHLVEVLLLAAQHPQAAGQAFNVSDAVADMPPTVHDCMMTVAEAVGASTKFRSIPRPLAMAAAHVMDRAYRLASAESPPPITPLVVVTMTSRVLFDATKAVDRLGWQPHIEPLDGLRAATQAIMLRSP